MAHSDNEYEIAPDILQEITQEAELQPAVFEFNKKPSKGIALLCQARNVEPTPKAIAEILHVVPGLLSTQIGEYLAKKENSEILAAYFLQLDLKFPYLVALRMALSQSLHLPGEGELIDHIVETWAHCYVSQNPEFGLPGTKAYQLAFACVLLNSDLHNPVVKRRMTVRDFIVNCRGAISEEELKDEVLHEIYDSIKNEPFHFKSANTDEILALSAPRAKGRLEKRGQGWLGTWKAHFFVLANSCLYYFNDTHVDGESPQGMIQLVSVSVTPIDDDKIELSSLEGDLQYVKFKRKKPDIVRNVQTITFRASSKRSRDKWLYMMHTSCVYSSFAGVGVGDVSPGDIHTDVSDMNMEQSYDTIIESCTDRKGKIEYKAKNKTMRKRSGTTCPKRTKPV